jgi:hypothetical protein
MSKQKITALRQALNSPPGPHLDQQRLAELATAEAAGEPIENLYPAALAHLEHCLTCAEAYSELVTLALTAAENMASAAAAVSPEAVYTALLQQAAPTVPSLLIESLVVQLPLRITTAPTSATQITPEWVQPAAHQPSPRSPWTDRLLPAIRQNLPALRLYLEQAAAATWQQAADLRLDVNGRLLPLHLVSSPLLREERVTWYTAGESIQVEVARLSPLACRLTVRLRPAAAAPLAGRSVTIRTPQESQTAETDGQGVAHFEPVAIAALPQLTIRIQPAG